MQQRTLTRFEYSNILHTWGWSCMTETCRLYKKRISSINLGLQLYIYKWVYFNGWTINYCFSNINNRIQNTQVQIIKPPYFYIFRRHVFKNGIWVWDLNYAIKLPNKVKAVGGINETAWKRVKSYLFHYSSWSSALQE